MDEQIFAVDDVPDPGAATDASATPETDLFADDAADADAGADDTADDGGFDDGWGDDDTDAAGFDPLFAGGDDGLFGWFTDLFDESDAGGAGSSIDDGWADGGDWDAYSDYQSDHDASVQVSNFLAEYHATNLEIIDNIDGSDDYEYTVEYGDGW